MPEIKGLLFDCDNTLVLSEPIAFRGCAKLSNEILEKHNIDKRYTPDELQKDFVGKNFRGLMMGLQERHSFTMTEDDMDNYVKVELEEILKALAQDAEPCEGANEVLSHLKNQGHYKMAVVSSSAGPRLAVSLKRAQQDHFFGEHVYSAATSLPVPTTKPDPAVYLYSCEKLGLRPNECIAVEDSKSGATAANRAGIHLIGYVGVYPDKEERDHMIKVLRDECGAVEILHHWSEFGDCLRRIEAL